ncbi:MAG: pyrroloquinoline quinone biosynthesis protein PqqE [Pseudomonas sp.]
MQISSTSAINSGLNLIQAGQHRVDQAATQIAAGGVTLDDSVNSAGSSATGNSSAGSQSSSQQIERLHSVDRSQQTDSATNVVQLELGKIQAQLGVKVAKASDEVLGTLIDTHA